MQNSFYETCNQCGKKFEVDYIIYPCNMEGRRESYITCPYCDSFVRYIHLNGNEDILEKKI